MATGIKYQSKNPIKLQEFLANRLLSSPFLSPALARSAALAAQANLESRAANTAQPVLLPPRGKFSEVSPAAKMNADAYRLFQKIQDAKN